MNEAPLCVATDLISGFTHITSYCLDATLKPTAVNSLYLCRMEQFLVKARLKKCPVIRPETGYALIKTETIFFCKRPAPASEAARPVVVYDS